MTMNPVSTARMSPFVRHDKRESKWQADIKTDQHSNLSFSAMFYTALVKIPKFAMSEPYVSVNCENILNHAGKADDSRLSLESMHR